MVSLSYTSIPNWLTPISGIKSKARACIPGEAASKPVHTGFAAYRATVEASELSSDPDTAWLLEKPALNVW